LGIARVEGPGASAVVAFHQFAYRLGDRQAVGHQMLQAAGGQLDQQGPPVEIRGQLR
jgi:hypothetical protein